jgi:hypothetical protein
MTAGRRLALIAHEDVLVFRAPLLRSTRLRHKKDVSHD